MTESHETKLKTLCRIYGESLDNDNVLVTKHIIRIEFYFFIRIDKDHPNTHPQKMC